MCLNFILINLDFFFFFCHTMRHADLPQPGIKPVPLHWEQGVLTTGPPGKS